MKKEAALKPYEEPIMKPDDLRMKIVELNREVGEILIT